MKKSIFILASAAMLFALAGCEKKTPAAEEKQAEGELIEKTFYANQGGKEKTTLDPSLATLWSEGDAIKVYPSTGGAGNDFTLESGAGESAATFTGLTTLSDVYVAFYPAGAAQSISGSTVTFNIPATQEIANAGSFGNNTVPMVGYTTDNTLAMKNVGSLLELGLKAKSGTSAKVVNIALWGNNNEDLAGIFTVDASVSVSGQPTAVYAAGGVGIINVSCDIEINSSDFTYLYISIPAGVFSSGFTATLIDAEDNVAEVTTNDNLSKGAAKITKFEADDIEFETPGPEDPTDACGNTYNTVEIGEQVWLAENMHCNKYDTGSERPGVEIPTSSSAVYTPYYTDASDKSKWSSTEYAGDLTDEQVAMLGYLYNWAAAVGIADGRQQTAPFIGNRQGICPNGFHIPTRAEWNTLRDYLGGEYAAGREMKTTSGWYNGGNGEDPYGFAALPAGATNGSSVNLVGEDAFYRSSDADDGTNAYTYRLNYYYDYFSEFNNGKNSAFSVRCLRN